MEQAYYCKWDSAYGVVSSHFGNETYLILDNDQTVYTYEARHIKVGTLVIVSVVENEKYNRYAKCVIDAVCNNFDYEAA